jgi:fructose-1,6-bisphosphatase I
MDQQRAKFLSIESNPITLSRSIMTDQRRHPEAKGDMTMILSSIMLACKFVSNAVRKAGIASLVGLSGTSNVQGEDQKPLDILANDIFINSLKFCNKIAALASEEETGIYIIDNPEATKYIIAFDPLDGSSNIDVNVSIGSIFAIWKKADNDKPVSVEDFYINGSDVEIAGYCIYGSSTQMVLATREGKVDCFTLDNSIGDFILTHPNLKIPKKGNIYSVNEGNSYFWSDPIKEYVKSVKDPQNGPTYSLRYVGSMVSDIHRTLLYGGIFLYPADKKSPSGKLRLLYEVFPMSLIVEKAGGKAVDGHRRLLDIRASHIHQRSPCILGSPDDVDTVLSFYERFENIPKTPEEVKKESDQ